MTVSNQKKVVENLDVMMYVDVVLNVDGSQ